MNEPRNQSKAYRKAMAIARRRLAIKPTKGAVKAWADAMREVINTGDTK